MIEVMIAVAIVTSLVVGVISLVLLGRSMAELDKQRTAAISYARSYLEDRRRDPYPALTPLSDVVLDDFNTPTDVSDDLSASLEVRLFEVNEDGSRGTELSQPPLTGDRFEVSVAVGWNRTGSLSSRRTTETLVTYVTPDNPFVEE